MIWGGIMGAGTDLVIIVENLNVQGYVDNILRPDTVPFLRQVDPLMHNYARLHVAALTRIFLAQQNKRPRSSVACLPTHRT